MKNLPPFYTRHGGLILPNSARIVSGKVALEFSEDGKTRMICGDIPNKKSVVFTAGFEKVPEFIRSPTEKMVLGKSTASFQMGVKSPGIKSELVEPRLELDLTTETSNED